MAVFPRWGRKNNTDENGRNSAVTAAATGSISKAPTPPPFIFLSPPTHPPESLSSTTHSPTKRRGKNNSPRKRKARTSPTHFSLIRSRSLPFTLYHPVTTRPLDFQPTRQSTSPSNYHQTAKDFRARNTINFFTLPENACRTYFYQFWPIRIYVFNVFFSSFTIETTFLFETIFNTTRFIITYLTKYTKSENISEHFTTYNKQNSCSDKCPVFSSKIIVR